MRYLILFITLCFLIVPNIGYCEELTQEKKAAIKELLEITGTIQMVELMTNVMIQKMANMMKRSKPNIDPKAFDILNQEVNTILHEELVEKESFQAVFYPIYHKYLTLEEIKGLIQFYKTPLGMKTISVLGKVTQEGLQAGQAWGLSLGPQIQQRVLDRFKKEGII